MSCEHCREELMGLEPAEFDSVEHLKGCEACQAFAAEILAMDEAMADVADDFAEAGDFEREWVAAKGQAGSAANRTRWWSMGALTTLAAAAAILFVVVPEIGPKAPGPDPMAKPTVADPVAAEPEPSPEPVAEPQPKPAFNPAPRRPSPKPRPRPTPRPAAAPAPAPSPPPPVSTPVAAPDPEPEPEVEAEPEEASEPEADPSPATPDEPTASPTEDPIPETTLTLTVVGEAIALEVRCPNGHRQGTRGNGTLSLRGLPPQKCDLFIGAERVGKVQGDGRYTVSKKGDTWTISRD